MFKNIDRDYDKTLKEQIKEGTDKGWEYMGCFGNTQNRILKFLVIEKWKNFVKKTDACTYLKAGNN